MDSSTPLAARLNPAPAQLTIVLFSQQDCEFCAEVREHYLKPLAASRRPNIMVAEVDVEGAGRMRGWSAEEMTQKDFATTCGARFAPTVMFFDARGRSVAAPIVGLSRDFFGSYLEQRIASALHAIGDSP